jgi:hypothetical protein
LGGGEHPFKEGEPQGLKLIDARAFSSGVVVLAYQPAGGDARS